MTIQKLYILLVLILLTLAGCGSNAGNPDAPSAVSAHERGWVTYHRDFIVNAKDAQAKTVNGELIVDGALIDEHVNHCRVCHGSGFAGAGGGAAGSACLDCHVLDPVKYPVRCFSCHGGAGKPIQTVLGWYSSSRALRGNSQPPGQNFIDGVKSGGIFHLKHDGLPDSERDTEEDCRQCHGSSDSQTTVETHHDLVRRPDFIGFAEGCFYCHTFVFNPDGTFDFSPERNCTACHGLLTK